MTEMPASKLLNFTFSFRANGRRHTFTAKSADGKCLAEGFGKNGRTKKMPAGFLEKIGVLMREHRLYEWADFDETDEYARFICESFSLEADFEDGTRIYAKGNGAFPDGFMDVNRRVHGLFGIKI